MFNINTNMEKTNLYNIHEYSDEELFEILDLNNPSDRELEAKILMMIHKYEKLNTKSGKKLSAFFERIYDHFFDDDDDKDEDEKNIEGMENLYYGDTEEDAITNLQLTSVEQDSDFSDEYGVTDYVNENETETGTEAGTDPLIKEDDKKVDSEKAVYVKGLEYTRGLVNPILKQTIKRIISIDSQYRPDKSTMTTSFTFNLSDPLKDVLSLKLYSIQIPVTWYTVNRTFGSNFFILKGRTEGLNNGNHDISFNIDPGNYEISQTDNEGLVGKLNANITSVNDTIDANIIGTELEHSTSTGMVTFTGFVDKRYNESSYYMKFDSWTTPIDTDTNRVSSIPSYLGFMSQTNYINVLKSPNEYALNSTTSNDAEQKFTLTADNKTITIYQYYGSFPYSDSSTKDIERTISSELNSGTYTRQQLFDAYNTALSTDEYLTDSYIKQVDVDSGNNVNSSLTELKVKFSRTLKTETNATNDGNIQYPNIESKTLVILPNDTELWLGATSCFRFDTSYNELSTIFSDEPAVEVNDVFIIEGNPYIELKSIAPNFVTTLNDISFALIDNSSPGYTITEYIDAINESIRTYDTNNNNILNAPAEDYVFEENGDNTYQVGTYAYLRDNIFHLHVDIDKTFTREMYEIDLTDSDVFRDGSIYLHSGDEPVSTTLSDLTIQYDASYAGATVINVTNTNSSTPLVCKIKPKTNTENGNENDVTYEIRLATSKSQYTNYPELETEVNEAFSSFEDPLTGLNIFNGIELGSEVDNDTNSFYVITFSINISKKLLSKNYQIQFIDDSTNDSWRSYLKIDDTMVSTAFDLSYNIPTTEATIVTNDDDDEILEVTTSGNMEITGNTNIALSNTINVSALNNKIEFIAYEDGVVGSTGANNFSIEVTPSEYSVATLIAEMNARLGELSGVVGANTCVFERVSRVGEVGSNYISMSSTIKRDYDIRDYNLVFYDEDSFVECFAGSRGVQTVTWDSTIGWTMGFREFTSYDLSITDLAPYTAGANSTVGTVTVTGDTAATRSDFKYFLLCLDDFNQSRLNDGLVTIGEVDTSTTLPSYASRAGFVCDPITGEKVYSNATGLTQNQTYAVNATTGVNTTALGSSVSTSSYGKGPYASDVFGLIPLKDTDNGQTFSSDSGSLQVQERSYFGPVNIKRMSVRLLTDKGNLVDLNNSNWSFSLISEQLYSSQQN
jgi:hypothetical protein